MRPRPLRVAMAAVTTAVLSLTVSPAVSVAAPQGPEVQIISPVNDDTQSLLSGPFKLVVSVDLHGNASADLSPSVSYGNNYVPATPRRVTAAECPTLCTISIDVDPAAWETPLPSGWVHVEVYWSSAVGNSVATRLVRYVAPVENVWITAFERDETAASRGYHPMVMDTGGAVVLTGNPQAGRIPGEVLEARVYPGSSNVPLPAPVVSGTGSWDQGAQPHIGRIRLETARLAAGSYRLLVRARHADGGYGWGSESVLTVRHSPVVETDARPFLLAGKPLAVSVSVNRPLPTGVIPGSVQVSIDGGPAQVLPVPFWNTLTDVATPVQGSVQVPAALLPAGVRTMTTHVLDSEGRPLGAPATRQVRVVTFTEQASVPTMVVGQRSAITFRGTAPAGMAYDSCSFAMSERVPVVLGGVCNRGDTSYTRSVAWTPQTAGPGRVEFSVRTVQGVHSDPRIIPVTIYASRTATLSAASSSAYGARPVATVTVRDLKNLFSPVVAVNGVAVVLQRKASGSTTWLNVGSGRTDATGRALVAFTNTVNGRLRAVVTSSVPAKTIITAERAVTSVGIVSWSSLPTSTRSGTLAYASVITRPYERGASVRVQARFLGDSSWTTFGSASVSSTGAARPGLRLYRRGTWEVRVIRVSTTLRAGGYSTVRRVAVR